MLPPSSRLNRANAVGVMLVLGMWCAAIAGDFLTAVPAASAGIFGWSAVLARWPRCTWC